MSGSSLDGLDIVYTHFTEISGKWTFEIACSDCVPYSSDWKSKLKNAQTFPVPEFLKLHTAYGHYTGSCINDFIEKNELQHKVDFIASHGHTVWHEPEFKTTAQIGDGAAIAAATQLPVISDLRNIDIALGGQGAPIVPVADKYLLPEYDFCLNLGGIANVTVNGENPVAFDICPANQLLDHFANEAGKEYDADGALAQTGSSNDAILNKINQHEYYKKAAPKSLHNGFVQEAILHLFDHNATIADKLRTAVMHIAQQISKAVLPYANNEPRKMLVTGGGAFNTFLVEAIRNAVKDYNITLIVPDATLVQYKEAIAMALIGTLRWREEANALSSVTGAQRNSVGGALWLS